MKLFDLLSLQALPAVCLAYTFKAENSSKVESSDLPVFYNLTASQAASDVGSSYYSSSFVTTTDQRQYMVLSHVLLTPAPQSYARYSIIEVTDPSNFWSHFQYFTTPNTTVSPSTGLLSLSPSNYTFAALSPDGFSLQRTAATADTFGFNITFATSARVLYNAGIGTFNFGAGETNQWSMPAGATSGTITLDGVEKCIDPDNSFTWYDRQVSAGAPVNGNWTWLEMHFDDSSIKASVWAIDQHPDGGDAKSWRFATVRDGERGALRVVPFALVPDEEKTWTSVQSNITYPLRWKLDFGEGEELVVESVREDQELFSETEVSDSAYQGFVTIEGTLFGEERKGFGLVEVVSQV